MICPLDNNLMVLVGMDDRLSLLLRGTYCEQPTHVIYLLLLYPLPVGNQNHEGMSDTQHKVPAISKRLT